MSLRFTTLASGSGGNASLVECGSLTILIDLGLGPRALAERLQVVGSSWPQIDAVLLTHTHGDHWRERTLTFLARHRIGLYCHLAHADFLTDNSRAFRRLQADRLVRFFTEDGEFVLGERLMCRPLALRHDAGPTFGFRFEGAADIFGEREALAYAADLGTWDYDLAHALADVDLLALEFNHDVALEKSSGRARFLIERVLGDEGHLSNAQAAGLLSEILARSQRRRLRHLVQLHLSHECNRHALAETAAHTVLTEWDEACTIHVASQHRPLRRLPVRASCPPPRRRATRTISASANMQLMLPGY